MEPIFLDADPDDADWIKAGAWDLSARNVDDLRRWLAASGISIASFKESLLYRSHVDREGFEWLRAL